MTDEQLIEAGDWPAIVNRYRESLAAFCGDDVAQAALLTVYGTDWPAGLLFRPVLYAVADRLARRHRRRQRRERRQFAEYAATV
jgi:DNA-directed RNA polymerase specialized sigma24 family protein